MGKKRRLGEEDPDPGPRFRNDMLICDIVDGHSGAKDVLLEFGLPCHRCIVAWSETLAEGCHPLALEVDRVLERLNALDGE
jgi:hybrid cluster-associated redox disulfide protein